MEETEYKKMYDLENNHWWFIAKRKFLNEILNHYCNKTGLRVLDVGCGTGAIMEFLDKCGYQVEGVDMSETALYFCRKRNLNVKKGLVDALDYPDNTFDLITALDVLEHLSDEKEALQEISRVLKPDGIFIATVPAHQFLWSYHDEALHHFRRYNKKSFLKIFQDNFDIKFVSYIHFFILFPAIFVRTLSKIFKNKADKKSDVEESGWLINKIMGFVYIIELTFFKVFGRLPIGLSLVVVVKKKHV